MQNLINKRTKKALSVALTASTIAWSIGITAFIPIAAHAAPGDVVKSATDKTVYKVAANGTTIDAFSSAGVFVMWNRWSDIKTVDLSGFTKGANVSLRPGTLVKATSGSSDVSYVTKDLTLRKVANIDAFNALGFKGGQIYRVPQTEIDVYTKAAEVTATTPAAEIREGALVKYGTAKDVYYVEGGKKRLITNETAFRANFPYFTSVVTIPATETYTDGTQLAAAETTVNTPKTKTVPTTPVVAGGLTVALASDTAASQAIASGTSFNSVLKVNLTAGSDADVKVTGIKVTKGGISQNTAVAGVSVYDGKGMRHGNVITSIAADNTATISFPSDAIVVPAGTTVPVTVKLNIIAGAAGQSGTINLSLAKAADITSSAASTQGTFPADGKVMSLVNGTNSVGAITLDAIQVHNNGATDATNVNINLGTTGQEVGRFRIASSNTNEDIRINKITLYNNGNAIDGDYTNITLVGQDGTVLSKVAQSTNRNVVFDLSASPYTLPKGTSRDFSVRIDTVSGSTRSVRFLVQNDYDLEAIGVSTGSGLLPTAAGTNDVGFPIGDVIGANSVNRITIASGTLLWSRATDTPTGNISAGGSGIVLGKWKVKAVGEDMEVRLMTYNITRSAATDFGGTFKINLNDVNIFSVAGSSATYGAATNASLSTFPVLKAGQEATITAVADILTTAAQGLTYSVALDVTSVKRMQTNDITDPTVAAVGSNTLTVTTAALTLSRNSAFGNTNVVAGQQNAKVGSFILQAGATEAVSVTSLTVALSNVTNVSNLVVKSGDTQLGSATATPAASNAISITSFQVPANGTKTVDIYIDTNTSTTTTEIVTLTIAGASGVASGVSVTATGSPSTGQTITFGTGGTLSTTLNTSVTPTAHIIHSAMVDEPVASINLTANNFEDINVKTIQLVITNGQSNVKDASVKLFERSATGTETVVGTGINVIGGLAEFGGLNYTVPKDATKTLNVKLSTTNTATLISDSAVQVGIAYIEATGAAGGATLKPGGTVNTTWGVAGGDTALAGTAHTVGSNEGFEVGDVVFAQNPTNGGTLGMVTAKSGTTSLTVGARAAIVAAASGTISKIATGATSAFTQADASGDERNAGAVLTAGSTRAFSVGDPVLVFAGTAGAQLGWVTTVTDSTAMTVRTTTNLAAAVTRVSKIGAGSPLTTTATNAASLTAAPGAITVTSTAGFNVGDVVIYQVTDANGTFGIVTAVTNATTMSIAGNAAVTANATTANNNITRIGTNSTAVVTTAATAGVAAPASTATTVTSTTGFGVGDVIVGTYGADAAQLGRVVSVGSATSVNIASGNTATGTVAASRVARLPGAAASARLMTVEDVEPVITVATGSPSGTASPQSNQEVARLAVKSDGDRDLSFTSLVLRKSGSNAPAANVTRFDLFAGTTLLSRIGTTNITGTQDDSGGSVAALSGTVIELCNSAARSEADEIAGISAAELAHISVGDRLSFVTAAATVTGTVTAKSAVALAACNVDGTSGATITIDTAIAGFTADQAVTIQSDTVYFDASVTSNNSAVTDIGLASQTITQGSTLTLSVFADTSSVRSGLGNVIATFGLVIPGTAGGAGGLSWSYTPSGGTAVTSTISDNYPVNLPTLSY